MLMFPWNNKTVPNVMIDLLDKCNIKCDVCYKRHSDKIKSMDEIKHDVDVATRLRDCQTVAVSGGEPTLHPNLLEVISYIKSKGYLTCMLTNGILLDDDFLFKLKSAGLDSILIHVDTTQNRPDLPKNAGLKDIQKRLYELFDRAIELGIDVAFSWTILEYSEQELDFVMNMLFEKPDVSFVVLSRGTDPTSLPICSDKSNDNKINVLSHPINKTTESMRLMRNYFSNKFGISPFSYLPVVTKDNKRLDNQIFIAYFLPITYEHNSIHYLYPFESNIIDKVLMYIPKILTGRFIFRSIQNPRLTAFRVLFNSLSRMRLDLLLKFFLSASGKNRYIRNKMIVYDDGPIVLDDGSIAVCEYCPTAILKNDELVRCCEIYNK
jgi:hypothetical protein